MARRKNNFIHIWDFLVWIMIATSGWFLWYSNKMRVSLGYFETSSWITWSEIARTVFFAFIVGYVVAKIIEKTKKRRR